MDSNVAIQWFAVHSRAPVAVVTGHLCIPDFFSSRLSGVDAPEFRFGAAGGSLCVCARRFVFPARTSGDVFRAGMLTAGVVTYMSIFAASFITGTRGTEAHGGSERLRLRRSRCLFIKQPP